MDGPGAVCLGRKIAGFYVSLCRCKLLNGMNEMKFLRLSLIFIIFLGISVQSHSQNKSVKKMLEMGRDSTTIENLFL